MSIHHYQVLNNFKLTTSMMNIPMPTLLEASSALTGADKKGQPSALDLTQVLSARLQSARAILGENIITQEFDLPVIQRGTALLSLQILEKIQAFLDVDESDSGAIDVSLIIHPLELTTSWLSMTNLCVFQNLLLQLERVI